MLDFRDFKTSGIVRAGPWGEEMTEKKSEKLA